MQECAKNEVIVETKANVVKVDDSAENNPALWKWSGSLDELTNRCAARGASAPRHLFPPKAIIRISDWFMPKVLIRTL